MQCAAAARCVPCLLTRPFLLALGNYLRVEFWDGALNLYSLLACLYRPADCLSSFSVEAAHTTHVSLLAGGSAGQSMITASQGNTACSNGHRLSISAAV